jgi:hypothetical protein
MTKPDDIGPGTGPAVSNLDRTEVLCSANSRLKIKPVPGEFKRKREASVGERGSAKSSGGGAIAIAEKG